MRTKLSVVVVVLLLGALAYVVSREPAMPDLSDIPGVIDIEPPINLPPLTLRDQDNALVGRDWFKDHWTVLFFGYTHCPDVCPLAMQAMSGLKRKLTPQVQARTRFVLASVDPKRDTPQQLKQYIRYFDEQFYGLTGDQAEVDRLALPLGAIYEYEPADQSGDYVVNHFAAVYIIDPRARVRAYILPPHEPVRLFEVYDRIYQQLNGKTL